jgi:predicted nucleic acid-binding protein
MKILIDTDLIIDVLRNVKKAVKLLEKLIEGNELYISGITEGELFSGRDLKDKRKEKIVLTFLSKFQKVNPTNEILQLAGEFRRKYNVSFLDCIIAATAYKIEAKVLTKNLKDFQKIKEVRLYKAL